MGGSDSRGTISLSDSPSEDRQPPCISQGGKEVCVGGGLSWQCSRVPAAPSGTQRHHEDSVDNEQSL